MGVIVNVVEEIRSRCANAITTGQPLAGLKRVQVGSIVEVRKNNDLDIINIDLTGGSLQPRFQNKGNNDILKIDIALITNKLSVDANNSNTLYKITGSLGALFLFEKLANVLDKKTTGEVDLTFNGHVTGMRKYDFDIVEERDDLIHDVGFEQEPE
jgi:hypothetical protein